jgi:endonuclease/exonuclease/phosphatase family metal-dependent hydrolase
MRILSLNCWGGACGAALIDYIAGARADVFCLQEVTRAAGTASEWQTYRDGAHVLAQRSNLFCEIAAALPDHSAHFAAAAIGALETADGGQIASEWGLATFVGKDFPIIGQFQSFIHGDFSPDGWGEHPRSRNAQGFRLFDWRRRRSLAVVNLHGLRDIAGKGDTPARQLQAQRIATLVGILRSKGDETVVCGDFNVLPESVTFGMLAALGLADLVTGRGHTDTRTSHYRKQPRFADYMLVSANVAVADFQVVEAPEVSDHRPLLLTVG